MFRWLLLPRWLVERHADRVSRRQILCLCLERGRVVCDRRFLPGHGAVGARLVHERLVLRDGRFERCVGRVLSRLVLSSFKLGSDRMPARPCVCERVDGGADRVQRWLLLRLDWSVRVDRFGCVFDWLLLPVGLNGAGGVPGGRLSLRGGCVGARFDRVRCRVRFT